MSLELNLIEFDINGNLYIKNNDDIYMFCINSSDDVFLEKIINKEDNTIQKYDNITVDNKLKKSPKENQLHMKSMNEAINEIDKNKRFPGEIICKKACLRAELVELVVFLNS